MVSRTSLQSQVEHVYTSSNNAPDNNATACPGVDMCLSIMVMSIMAYVCRSSVGLIEYSNQSAQPGWEHSCKMLFLQDLLLLLLLQNLLARASAAYLVFSRFTGLITHARLLRGSPKGALSGRMGSSSWSAPPGYGGALRGDPSGCLCLHSCHL